MFKNITNDNKKMYKITKPGEHIFYFENKNDDITFNIMCENAEVKIYGLYRGKNTDQFTLTITQDHTVPNSKSTALIKSVLDNKSIFNFTGTIRIAKNADDTIAHLTNKNLLLNKNAHVITTPQLKVIPRNVKCAHAAITAPLDENQINYLTTRGIANNVAKRILIDGFINEITKIKNPAHK